MKQFAISSLSLLALAACGGGATTPAFQADGLQAVLGQEVFRGGDTLPAGNTGYVYHVGLNSGETALAAEADLTAPSTLIDPPIVGSAVMRGDLELRGYLFPNTASGSLSATGLSRNTTLEAEVDFANRILTADNGSGAGLFEVDGVFATDGTLSGTTRFQGITGDLGGDVSATDAIGVFEGSSANGVFAGGFVVSD